MKVDMSREAVTERLRRVDQLNEEVRELMASHCIGDCSHCKREFGYRLIHNGFNDSSYAYCDRCGKTAFLSAWCQEVPARAKPKFHDKIGDDIEPFLQACSCGGSFTAAASPRCPDCRTELSALDATEFIERNAPGTAGGWRWQGNWHGQYCIVIENRSVQDNWKQECS